VKITRKWFPRVPKVLFNIKFCKRNPYPEYYNREVERLTAKVRRAYSFFLAQLRTSYESPFYGEGECWTELYNYLKRRKENRANIPARQ